MTSTSNEMFSLPEGKIPKNIVDVIAEGILDELFPRWTHTKVQALIREVLLDCKSAYHLDLSESDLDILTGVLSSNVIDRGFLFNNVKTAEDLSMIADTKEAMIRSLLRLR